MAYVQDDLIRAIEHLMSGHPLLSESEIGSHLGIHRHTVHRALEIKGKSVALLRKRLVLGQLLAHCHACGPASAESLKAVWTRAGFSSASAFSRFIRHAVGCTPVDFCDAFHSGQLDNKLAILSLDFSRFRER
jgi:AraC-like DNA-binding protein